MNTAWNHFLTAVMLLTRVPVSRWCRYSPEAVASSVAYFPVVGALVGAVGAAVLLWTANAVPAALSVLLSMGATLLLTGAFHEDGLADAADGILGGQTPARRLEIMKDSRIGSYGAIALWFVLSAKFVLLQALLAKGTSAALAALVLAHALGRTASVAVMQLQPYVGVDSARSQPFCRRLSRPQLLTALIPPAVLILLSFPLAAIPIVAAVALVVFFSASYFQSKLGGITGDCLGASEQITEITVLAVLLTRI